MERCDRPHAVMVPLPAQGHINALMHFAHALAARGFLITFLHTDQIYRRLFKQPPSNLPNFRFRVMPDAISGDRLTANDIGEIFDALQKHAPAVEAALRRINDDGPPITCVISDSFMACTHAATANLKLPRVLFWPYCAAAAVAQANTPLLISHGHIPVKADELKNPTKLITCLGEIPPLVPKDLRSFYREELSSTLMFRASVYESEMQNKADWVLVNTFEELEGVESIQALSKGFPTQAVGPVFLLQEEGDDHPFPQNLIKSSLWEEEEELCMTWLESQQQLSVLYVSFGSLALMSNEQIQELGLGLEAGGYPFLWVIRPDLVEGDSGALPEGYLDRVRGRGLLVKWAPQLKVLRHPSVGGFLTHNGWNSTIESIGAGVPMIGWPYWSEQFLNCRFAKDVWKVGVDLEGKADEKGFVKGVEIERAIKSMMEGEEGREARRKAAELKEAAAKAVQPGGSSYRNVETFAEHVKNVWLGGSGGNA